MMMQQTSYTGGLKVTGQSNENNTKYVRISDKLMISFELWEMEMEAFRASFTNRDAYDVMPSPANLSQ